MFNASVSLKDLAHPLWTIPMSIHKRSGLLTANIIDRSESPMHSGTSFAARDYYNTEWPKTITDHLFREHALTKNITVFVRMNPYLRYRLREFCPASDERRTTTRSVYLIPNCMFLNLYILTGLELSKYLRDLHFDRTAIFKAERFVQGYIYRT